MKSEILNLRWAAMVLWVCLVSAGGGTEAGSRVVAMDTAPRLVVPLPPLAKPEGRLVSSKTWKQSGTIDGSIETARRDFECSLRDAHWKRDQTIAMGRTGHRSELTTWVSGRRRILMMVWEKEAGVCGFAWGDET